MGQRLTIQIFKNTLETDSLATIYYQWNMTRNMMR